MKKKIYSQTVTYFTFLPVESQIINHFFISLSKKEFDVKNLRLYKLKSNFMAAFSSMIKQNRN
jgi:hypothetical protein